MGADEQQEQPPADLSPPTSTEVIDGEDVVGPVELPAKAPAPVGESKPARVGPEKLSVTRRKT